MGSSGLFVQGKANPYSTVGAFGGSSYGEFAPEGPASVKGTLRYGVELQVETPKLAAEVVAVQAAASATAVVIVGCITYGPVIVAYIPALAELARKLVPKIVFPEFAG